MKAFYPLFISCLAFLTLSMATAQAKPPHEQSPQELFISSAPLTLGKGQLKLNQNFLLAENSKSQASAETVQLSYRYKLLISDLSALALLIAIPFTDHITELTPLMAVASYALAPPLIHYFESNNQDGGKKALMSVWYRLGIPALISGLALGSTYLFADENSPGLIVGFALGLGTIGGGLYGLFADYSNAYKTETNASDSASASREVLMWQSLMENSVKASLLK